MDSIHLGKEEFCKVVLQEFQKQFTEYRIEMKEVPVGMKEPYQLILVRQSDGVHLQAALYVEELYTLYLEGSPTELDTLLQWAVELIHARILCSQGTNGMIQHSEWCA